MDLLTRLVPSWPDSLQVYTDRVNARDRRSRQRPSLMDARAEMLRPTGRKNEIVIYVASLAVLAWSEDDLREVMAAIKARRAMLVSAEDGECFTENVEDAVARWRAASTKSRLEGAAKRGGAVSAKVRGDRVSAGVEKIKDRWPLPSSEWSTAALLAEAGVSRNGANARLGGREKAQARYQAAIKRKLKRNNSDG